MLTKVAPSQADTLAQDRVLHSVFSPRDCWYSTGNLLKRDIDGDYWFVARVAELVRTKDGRIVCLPVEDALYKTGLVALAAAYGTKTPNEKSAYEELVIAIVLKKNAELSPSLLDTAYFDVHEAQRPLRVLVVTDLPMSDGYRPKKSALRAAQPKDLVSAYRYQNGRYQPI